MAATIGAATPVRNDMRAIQRIAIHNACVLAPEDVLLDPKLLKLLDLLHRTRSVTQAAELLGQSQPTVSIWLARLRKALGDPLFVRTPEGMQPTPRADALIGPVREALASLQRLAAREAPFDPARAERSFRICMTDASHITLLPPLLAHVRALAPGLTLSAARIDEHTAAALQSGEADLAIGFVPWLDAGFYQQVLYPQDWVCLANARHPRINKALTRRCYEAEGHAVIAGGTGAELLATALKRAKVQRRVVLELPGFLGLGMVVGSTDLIATLPRNIGETLAASAGLAVHACPVAVPPFEVKQHWHARYHHEAGNRWLRGVVATLFLRAAPKTARR
jgi:DNA-binding transcriptional LysR family regulator